MKTATTTSSDSDLINLTEATKRVPRNSGKRPNTSTIWRWCRRGIKSRNGNRITLAHVRVGGRIYTSDAALTDFFHAVAESDLDYFQREPLPQPIRASSKQRLRQIEQARKTLEAAGI